jgi:hypothetical protein
MLYIRDNYHIKLWQRKLKQMEMAFRLTYVSTGKRKKQYLSIKKGFSA